MTFSVQLATIVFALTSSIAQADHPATSPAAAATQPTSQPASRPATGPVVNRWERDVAAFRADDEREAFPAGGVVFVGSSSIRGWRSLATDFPDHAVLNRGFGGSQLIDVIRYVDVLVLKHRPRVVVLYAGENDIASGRASPQDVARYVLTFVDLVHHELPEARILVISLKPSPSRQHLIPRYQEANRLIKDQVDGIARVRFIDVFTPMLNETGQPRPELFHADRLHLSPAGFALWRAMVGDALR